MEKRGDHYRGWVVNSPAGQAEGEFGLPFTEMELENSELNDLPWEYLYNPRLNRFLSLSVETPLVRYLDVPRKVQPLQVELPVCMLVVISSPTDLTPLDVEREWKKMSEAMHGMESSVAVDRLETPSLDALQRQLRRKPYNILHFIGHGGFDEQHQDGVLFLED